MSSAILLLSCPDQPGIIAALANFIAECHGNILAFDQYVDHEDNVFFARMEWDLDTFSVPPEDFPAAFAPLAARFSARWQLHTTLHRPRIAILVSKQAHCLYDILYRTESGEWDADPVLVLSNHETLRPLVERHGLPFRCIPVTAATKATQEPLQIAALKEARPDLVILARYMQILSPDFINAFPLHIINIHHSFLPAFAGARPYYAAHARGVKIIGATAHFATEDLDQGPIICQDIQRVPETASIDELVELGKDIEKRTLSAALKLWLEHRVFVYAGRTFIL